ncbi:N-acetylmannosamine kinase [Vibrio sp. S4M6]|uniref:N-acetylmannosamine kinase n=1 Tax=Vibrio sinus TaxID=2946865 RepID=UPI00202A8A50|nr:N-acetylmannosamine kinase [Vibrio sinus]MCL9783789.1 N-acetylmannosamine kinase [Vibrio sinus]
MSTCLALDIGGTKIAAAVIHNGHIERRVQVDTPSSRSPELLSQSTRKVVLPWCSTVDFIAVASTGVIHDGQLSALNPSNLGGLNLYPLQKEIHKISGKKVWVMNDAQAAAWAEYQSLMPSVSDMAFITVSTGVGGGLVIDNKLVTGKGGIAGHIGHTLADPNGPTCGCGRQGCLESIASGRAMASFGRQYFGHDCTGKTVFEFFQRQDPNAIKIVSQSAKAIANAIANLKMSFDIQAIVLGGSIGLAPGYLPLVHRYLTSMPNAYQVPLTLACNGDDAGLIGVASWATRQQHNSLQPLL